MRYLKLFENFNIYKLIELPEYKEGDYHQLVMNLGYDEWQKNEKWDYSDMVNWVAKKFGDQFKMLILIGKYNQQVGNGGHHQYWDNGYATGGGGVFSKKDGIELHLDMMDLFKDSELIDMDPVCKQVYEIMDEFRHEMEDFDEHCQECDNGYYEDTCYECSGGGTQLEYCETCDGEGEVDDETCSECGGDGEVEVDCEECDSSGTSEQQCQECDGSGYVAPNIDHLDNKYYEINDKFMDVCNEYAKKIIDDKV